MLRFSSFFRGRSHLTIVGLASLAAPVIFVAVMVGPSLFGNQLFAAGDLIEQAAPWVETTTVTGARNVCIPDTIDSVLPSELTERNQIAAGDSVPLWDGLVSGGASSVDSPTAGLTSPLYLPSLLVPESRIPAVVKLLEILFGIGGVILWTRRLGLSRTAGAVGGLVFVSSGFMVMWTNWPQTRTAAIFPLVFYGIERIVQDRTVRSAWPLTLSVAALLLGGFPAIAVHALYVGIAYGIVRVVVQSSRRRSQGARADWLRPTLIAGAGIFAGVVMVGFQLMTMMSSMSAVDLGYRANQWRAIIPTREILTTAFPLALGTCSPPTFFWSGVNPVEGTSFVGAAALMLTAVAVLRPRPKNLPPGVRGFALATAILTLAATFLGGPLNYVLQLLPLMGNSGLHRLRGIGGLMFALLAAIGFEGLRRVVPSSTRRRIVEAVGVVLAFAVLLAMAWEARALAPGAAQWHGVRTSIIVGLVTGLVVAGVALLTAVFPSWRYRHVLLAVVPMMVLVEALIFTNAFWPRVDPKLLYRDTDTTEYLAGHLDSERFAGVGNVYWKGAGRVDGLRSFNGHAFVTTDWGALLRSADPKSFESPTNHRLSSADSLASPLLDRFAVRYGVADMPERPPGALVDPAPKVVGASTVLGSTPAAQEFEPSRIRALVLDLAHYAPIDLAHPATFHVEVRDADGKVIASGQRRARTSDVGEITVPIAGELTMAAGHGPLSAAIWVENSGGVTVAANGDSQPWVGAIVADANDTLTLVRAVDSQIYLRQDADSRIRWASSVTYATTLDQAVAAMSADPASTTVLRPADAGPPTFSGKPASLTILKDSGDLTRVRVDAQGAGMLVIADSDHPGLVARVDGRAAPLVEADYAMVGVAVPQGSHVVEVSYDPSGWTWPLYLASVASVTVLGVALWPLLRRRRWRADPAGPPMRRWRTC